MSESAVRGPLHVDRPRIRAAHEARLRDWPKDPKPLTVRATASVTESHGKTARVGSFTIESDEGAIVGGSGLAPTPLSYFVSAIGLAVLTDVVRAFAVFDLPTDDLWLEIEAEFPLGKKYGSEPVDVAASAVRYSVDVATDVPRGRVAAAVAWAERSCHAVHSLPEPVPVTGRHRVGGEAPDPPA